MSVFKARQLHQEMAIFDEYLVSSKAQMGNTPKFPSLASPSLILKGFWFWDQDARILPSTLFSTMFRSPSAVPGRSVVSANNGGWKNWTEAGIFWKSLKQLAKGHWWDMISITYPSSPWSAVLMLGSECVAAFRMTLQKQCNNAGQLNKPIRLNGF